MSSTSAYDPGYKQAGVLDEDETARLHVKAPEGQGEQLVEWAGKQLVGYQIVMNLLDPTNEGVLEVVSIDDGEPFVRLKKELRGED